MVPPRCTDPKVGKRAGREITELGGKRSPTAEGLPIGCATPGFPLVKNFPKKKTKDCSVACAFRAAPSRGDDLLSPLPDEPRQASQSGSVLMRPSMAQHRLL